LKTWHLALERENETKQAFFFPSRNNFKHSQNSQTKAFFPGGNCIGDEVSSALSFPQGK